MNWKSFFAGIVVIIIIAGIAYGAYYFGTQKVSETPTSTAQPTSMASSTPKPVSSSLPASPSPAASPSPVDESALIKQAIYAKTGLNSSTAEVTINENTGTHAKGGIKEYAAVGGAYWLAAKTGSGWVAVYDGQAQPSCSQIEAYNFPTSMVPECLNSGGTVITR